MAARGPVGDREYSDGRRNPGRESCEKFREENPVERILRKKFREENPAKEYFKQDPEKKSRDNKLVVRMRKVIFFKEYGKCRERKQKK